MLTRVLLVSVLVMAAAAVNATAKQGVRKDWMAMTQAERDHFTRAVNLLKQNGGYDNLVHLHRAAYLTPAPWRDEVPDHLYRNGDQKGPAFLPWHRVQLNLYEKALQKAINDPNLRMPYWNYMEDAKSSAPTETLMWSAANGFGGTGRADDFVVVDGPFAYWPLKYADMGEAMLQRRLGHVYSHPSIVSDFKAAFEQTIYDEEPWSAESKRGFRNWVEGFYSERGPGQGGPEGTGVQLSLHAMAHAFVGRSMINSTSPNDPIFYMVHAFTDALWYSWQAKQLERFPGTTPLDHFIPKGDGPTGHNLDDALFELDGATARDVIDFRHLDYTYDVLPVPT